MRTDLVAAAVAAAACRPAPEPFVVPVPIAIPVPVAVTVDELSVAARPPLPPDRTIIRVLAGLPVYGECPHETQLSVVNPGSADEAGSIDSDDPAICAALSASDIDHRQRYFVAELKLTARYRQPGCEPQDSIGESCHGWMTEYVGSITRVLTWPAPSR